MEFQKEHHYHLDLFNEDVKTLEKVFQASALGFMQTCVCEPNEYITWRSERKRIMYVKVDKDGNDIGPYRPLAELDALTRKRALQNHWLLLLLEEATDDVQRLRDEVGGPVWELAAKEADE